MRIFGSDRISGLMQRMGMEEGVPIEATMVTRAIERAQKQVESQNFSMRKHLLEYDDVMNKQRVAVYRPSSRHSGRQRPARVRARARPQYPGTIYSIGISPKTWNPRIGISRPFNRPCFASTALDSGRAPGNRLG